MIIILKQGSGQSDADTILRMIRNAGAEGKYVAGSDGHAVVIARGEKKALGDLRLENHPLVEQLISLFPGYDKARRQPGTLRTKVKLGRAELGGDLFPIIAGPCFVETRKQFLSTAMILKKGGAHALRGGLFRARPHVDSFAGLGLKGADTLQEVARQTGLPVVTEVCAASDVALLESRVTCLQVPAEHMSNLRLLDAVGECRLPIILTRAGVATLDEFLISAERILQKGNRQVILCEQGGRGVASGSEPAFDIRLIPKLQRITHLPILVNPSHAAGVREYVLPLARAAVACGADGLLVEAHSNPQEGLGGGQAALGPAGFKQLMNEIEPFVKAVGRTLT
jgi:3-deoxy-7-phosphoheptulonate synthase